MFLFQMTTSKAKSAKLHGHAASTPRPRLQAVGCLSSAGQLRSATPKPKGDTRGNPSSQGMTLVYLSSLSIEHSHSIFWEKKS